MRKLICVTGQLRNAADNLSSWLDSGLIDDKTDVLFYVWDEIGGVDLNKAYMRSLEFRKKNLSRQIQVSNIGVYLRKRRNLTNEVDHIRSILGDRCEFKIEKYNSAYMYKAGELEITDALRKDTHPWWQGSIPVAYINHLCRNYILETNKQYDVYIRLQSEAKLDKSSVSQGALNELMHSNDNLLTSADTITPDFQVSIKFFAGQFKAFDLLMDAYNPMIEAYASYKTGTENRRQPIGERYLKQLCDMNNLKVNYAVKMMVYRERILPLIPKWKSFKKVESSWKLPSVIEVDREQYSKYESAIK